MGWTHYWERDSEISAEPFARAVADCSRLLGQVGIPIAGRDGTGLPIFRPDAIVFNGAIPDAVEPFEIHQIEFDRHGRRTVRSFCKTERAPYDLCVQLALIVFKQHLGSDISVRSDAKGAEWADAKRKCGAVLGYGDDFDLATE